jgi:hypothetical protein
VFYPALSVDTYWITATKSGELPLRQSIQIINRYYNMPVEAMTGPESVQQAAVELNGGL